MNTTARWLKITVACPAAATEAVSDLIGLLSGVGVDIRPLPDQGVNAITGFFALESEAAADEWLKRVIPELNRLYGLYDLPPPSPNTEIIDDQDWATSWRQFFSAFEVIPGLVIKPSWEDDRPGENRRVIIMDPGMAFGTGQHASTRMALSLIAACFRNPTGSPPKTVLDVGTGTGILAMAAAVFGAERVTAVDNDPEAVGIARTISAPTAWKGSSTFPAALRRTCLGPVISSAPISSTTSWPKWRPNSDACWAATDGSFCPGYCGANRNSILPDCTVPTA